jgi:hypothetical protein
MILGDEFCYIRMPRTASGTVSRTLNELGFGNKAVRSHSGLFELDEETNDKVGKVLSFGTVRNAWDWYISYVRYFTRSPEAFERGLHGWAESVDEPFCRIALRLLGIEPPLSSNPSFFGLPSDYPRPRGAWAVDQMDLTDSGLYTVYQQAAFFRSNMMFSDTSRALARHDRIIGVDAMVPVEYLYRGLRGVLMSTLDPTSPEAISRISMLVHRLQERLDDRANLSPKSIVRWPDDMVPLVTIRDQMAVQRYGYSGPGTEPCATLFRFDRLRSR